MKKLLCAILIALTVFSCLPVAAYASDAVAFVSYNRGNDANDGLTADTPKKSIGSASGKGCFGLVSKGGTLVVCEKMYFGVSYTWRATGATTITASHGGTSYKNPSPASNPASGVIKLKPGCVLTVASDLTLDDVILHSESVSDSIVVSSGATLTITDTVLTTSKTNTYFKIEVKKGGRAVINGGNYASVTGDGEIVIGGKATVAGGSSDARGAVCYVSYNYGNSTNDGLTPDTPKSALGQVDGSGIVGVVRQGGTVVVCEKMYVGSSYAWCAGGAVTITANYNGVDYKVDTPATNPASGVLKFKPGSTFTVGSDLTLDDIILFQQNDQCNIVVSPGVTFTVTESVITMSNRPYYMNIYVSKGAKAIINGGTFSTVSGDGIIKIGEKATVLEEKATNDDSFVYSSETTVCYLDYTAGNNANSGENAANAVKDYAAGLFKKMLIGGTAVICGSSRITGTNNQYALPTLPMPLTFTSAYGGEDFRSKEKCDLRFAKNTTLVISSDVCFDSIVLMEEAAQTTLRVTNNATLTVSNTAELRSALSNGAHYKIIVEKGCYAILSAEAQKVFTIEGDGTVLTYVDGKSEIFKHFLGNDFSLN